MPAEHAVHELLYRSGRRMVLLTLVCDEVEASTELSMQRFR